jgi:hypothetical protein
LRAPAFDAFVDTVLKARLFGFRAGKPHLCATLYADRVIQPIGAFGL